MILVVLLALVFLVIVVSLISDYFYLKEFKREDDSTKESIRHHRLQVQAENGGYFGFSAVFVFMRKLGESLIVFLIAVVVIMGLGLASRFLEQKSVEISILPAFFHAFQCVVLLWSIIHTCMIFLGGKKNRAWRKRELGERIRISAVHTRSKSSTRKLKKK